MHLITSQTHLHPAPKSRIRISSTQDLESRMSSIQVESFELSSQHSWQSSQSLHIELKPSHKFSHSAFSIGQPGTTSSSIAIICCDITSSQSSVDAIAKQQNCQVIEVLGQLGLQEEQDITARNLNWLNIQPQGLLGSRSYSKQYLGTSMYLEVQISTSKYLEVLQSAQKNLTVPRMALKYQEVPQST